MLSKIFKSKIFYSIFWVGFEKFGYSGIYFISTIFLARLLSPADFGVIGVLAIFVSFSQMIVESGLGGALVKKDEVSDNDYNTIFTFNLTCAIVLYISLFFLAPYIADFYQNDLLLPITRAVGLNIVFSALTLTQRVHLIRELQFQKQALISVSALALAVIASILIAYKGYGVWALVIQQLSYNIFYFIFIFAVVRYKPKLEFYKDSFKGLYGFGGKIFISSLLTVFYNEGISSIIAKIYDLVVTGLYYQAKKLVDFPINIFRALGDNVVFPLLSKINDGIEFKNQSSRLMKLILLVSLPLFIIFYFYSKVIIVLVLGTQWEEASEMLSILCLSSVAFVIDGVTKNILKATGKGNAILKSEFVKKVIGLALILVFVKFELTVFLYSIVVGNLIGCVINMYFVAMHTNYTIYIQLKDVMPIVIIAILSGVLGYYIAELLTRDSLYNLICGVVSIVLIYCFFSYLFVIKKGIVKN